MRYLFFSRRTKRIHKKKDREGGNICSTQARERKYARIIHKCLEYEANAKQEENEEIFSFVSITILSRIMSSSGCC